MSTPEEQIEAFERERLAAIVNGNANAMTPLLADDYVHVNSTGRVIGKRKFLESMAGRSRETTRGPLTIRVYGDTAMIYGDQTNRTEKADQPVSISEYVCTQVLRRSGDRWQLILMQLTQKKAK